MRDARLGLVFLAQPGHDVDQSVDAPLAGVHVMDPAIAVLGLADANVRQRVAFNNRIRSSGSYCESLKIINYGRGRDWCQSSPDRTDGSAPVEAGTGS